MPIAATTTVALVLLVSTTGSPGTAAAWIAPVVGVFAVSVAGWAIVRRRTERVGYEQRLTAWAASEAVLAERLRIAGDLHDLVSHGLGLITVRAASTRSLPQSPQVRAAFTDIEEASRHATGELRRMLTVLREPDAAAPREPLDDLSVLPAIVAAAATAGVRAELTVLPLGEVPAIVQLAVCRTVREALSNTARHAGPVGAHVRVLRDGDHVLVCVTDDGPAEGWPAPPGTGHGLAGLRERLDGLGGSLAAHPSGGGYRLTARIPA